MKKFFLPFLFVLSLVSVNAQIININGVPSLLVVDNNDGLDSKLSAEDKRKIRLKKYLTEGFKPSKIDDQKKIFFLRYNIFEDQMEFVKDDNLYYMQKNLNTKVFFRTLSKTYKCLNHNRDLGYYTLHIESDKLGLVTKETVRFIEAKKAETSYGEDKPANFRRQKDQHYFVMDNQLYKVEKKKKDFLAFFKSNQGAVKKHMKSKKLSYKNISDLKEIVKFYNSIN